MTSTPEQVIANITPQMIRDAAGWSQSEEDLRDTLRLAAVALDASEASEAEKADILAELLQSRMEIMSRGETITILEAERDALPKALTEARGSIKNARGAVESNQVVDKDVHGTLSRAIRMIDAALQSAADTPAPPPPQTHVQPVEVCLWLADLILDACLDGRSEEIDPEWTARDFTQHRAYQRILAAISPAPETNARGGDE